MALRGKPPAAITKRLKMFMFSGAGIGKTTAAVKFPNCYIIDAEKGTENYDKLIQDSGGAVFYTTDMDEAIQEVKSLLTERHQFRTLVIDPITTLYNDLLDKSEMKVGSDFGRHYGAANKVMKRLANLVMALDMNVVITSHAKKEYGDNLKVLGNTFDGWKQLDYWFDLVVELERRGKKRVARIVKTRIESFPDQDVFEWSYEAMRERYEKQYGPGVLDRPAATVALATSKQVAEMKELLGVVLLPEGTTDKWFAKAGVDAWEDMPAAFIQKSIDYVRGRLPGASQAPGTNGDAQEPSTAAGVAAA